MVGRDPGNCQVVCFEEGLNVLENVFVIAGGIPEEGFQIEDAPLGIGKEITGDKGALDAFAISVQQHGDPDQASW